MTGPTGLDLNPDPPKGTRLRPAAKIVAGVVIVAVGAYIMYGCHQRGIVQARSQQEQETVAPAGDEMRSKALAGANQQPPAPRPPAVAGAQPLPAQPLPPPAPVYRAAVYQPPAPPTVSAAEQRQVEAMQSPTTASGWQQERPWTQAQAPQGPMEAQRLPGELPMEQPRKDAPIFGRTPVEGDYVIRAGATRIPATLETEINSDLPTQITALVSRPVYDTRTGQYLLIPYGSKLVGVYVSRVAYGQDAVMAEWGKIIFPDASQVDLEGMSGQDPQGRGGFRGSVDRHYKRLLGFGLLTSVFSGAFALSQRPNNVLTYPSNTQIAGEAVGQQMAQLGSEVTRKNLAVQPTIKIPHGYRFSVAVSRDLVFEGPYAPMR